jgi:hypothetical protein
MPGSIFTILLPTHILVDPEGFSDVGTYKIEVSLKNSESSSDLATFNVIVTNSAPRFTSAMPDVSVPCG